MRCAVIWVLADSVAGESHFQVLVEWELDCDMGQPQQRGCESRIERANAFSLVHLARRIPSAGVLPRRSETFTARLETLGHEPGLDHPNRIGDNCRTGAGRN